jgi:GNAT superfamily N-acetyltransferase
MPQPAEIPDWLRRLAAAPGAFGDVPPGFERLLDERMCVFFGPNRVFTTVWPFRLDDPAAAVEEVRAAARERGVTEVDWWVADSAEPAGLVELLEELGLRLDPRDPDVTGMAMLEPPPAIEGVVARPVASIDELRAATEIDLVAFEASDSRREAALANVADEWENREGVHSRTFLAFVGGEPVGAGRSAYVPGAPLLVGGSVLPAARGRGAYRALVRARWDDAVERGTPFLLVHAGKMSGPILRRLGFQPLLTSRVLVDRL